MYNNANSRPRRLTTLLLLTVSLDIYTAWDLVCQYHTRFFVCSLKGTLCGNLVVCLQSLLYWYYSRSGPNTAAHYYSLRQASTSHNRLRPQSFETLPAELEDIVLSGTWFCGPSLFMQFPR